jgi:hypothetical protein
MEVENWIDLKDGQPNDVDTFYLAWTPDDGAMILAGWFIGHEDCTATHWMPLPAPPSNA